MKVIVLIVVLLSVISSVSAKDVGTSICKNFATTELNYPESKKFIKHLRDILNGRKVKQLAKQLYYPIAVFSKGKRLILRTEKEFLKQQKSIFTDHFYKKILKSKDKNNVCNKDGVGISSGMIWFTSIKKSKKKSVLKVISINVF